MVDDDDDYEEAPSAEELALIQKVTAEETKAVDALILGQCGTQWQKVAMIVGSSLHEFSTAFPLLPFIYMQLRISALVGNGTLEAQGNPMVMRRSEIRLAQKASQ